MYRSVVIVVMLFLAQVCSQCGEQIQACATTVREFEKEIHEVKTAAFLHCFSNYRCHLERAAFEQCFQHSLTATRASLSNGHFGADSFEDTAQRYVLSLDQCFSASSPVIGPTSDLAAILLDEDAIYARAIYGLEYADSVWGLPSGLNSASELDRDSVCFIRERKRRIFGNGINRIADSADPKMHVYNNLNTSCMLDDEQLRCYRRYLENDQDFQHLVVNQDRALRSCIRSLRLRSECRNNDGSTMRACLCSAREEFENRLEASLIECVRKSNALLNVKRPSVPLNNVRYQPSNTPSSVFGSMYDDPLWYSNSNSQITTGTLVNGQCFCACGKQNLNEYRDFLSDMQSETLYARRETAQKLKDVSEKHSSL